MESNNRELLIDIITTTFTLVIAYFILKSL